MIIFATYFAQENQKLQSGICLLYKKRTLIWKLNLNGAAIFEGFLGLKTTESKSEREAGAGHSCCNSCLISPDCYLEGLMPE